MARIPGKPVGGRESGQCSGVAGRHKARHPRAVSALGGGTPPANWGDGITTGRGRASRWPGRPPCPRWPRLQPPIAVTLTVIRALSIHKRQEIVARPGMAHILAVYVGYLPAAARLSGPNHLRVRFFRTFARYHQVRYPRRSGEVNLIFAGILVFPTFLGGRYAAK